MSNRKMNAFGFSMPNIIGNTTTPQDIEQFENWITSKYQTTQKKRVLSKYQKKQISKELKRKLKPIKNIRQLQKITADKETYKDIDWIYRAEQLILNDNTTTIDQAVETVTNQAKEIDLSNFAHLYGYYLNFACNEFWQDDETQFLSLVTHEPLFHLEHIRYLCAVMIRYIFSNENQSHEHIINKDIQLNYNAGSCMTAANDLLVEMFSDGKNYRNVQDFVSTSKSIEWNSDINLALYAYFNRGLVTNKANIDEAKIVFGALVYFAGFIDGKLEMQYSPSTMPDDCKSEFSKYLKLNGIIFTT